MTAEQRRFRNYRPAATGEILDALTRRMGVRERLDQYRAWALWSEVVGPQTAAHARPFRVRDGVLEVRVDHPVWMQQLQLLKPRILSRLNEILAPAAIRDIHWKHGRPPDPPPPTASIEPEEPPVLTPTEQLFVDHLIPDDGDELHLAWRRLLARHLRTKR